MEDVKILENLLRMVQAEIDRVSSRPMCDQAYSKLREAKLKVIEATRDLETARGWQLTNSD